MADLDVLKTDFDWIKQTMEEIKANQQEIFERLRRIEVDVESIKATKKPPINPWSLVFGIIASITTILLIVDKVNFN